MKHLKTTSQHDFLNILKSNKDAIWKGILKYGHLYFDSHRSGFVYSNFKDLTWDVIDVNDRLEEAEEYEDLGEDYSLVDDAYYLGVVWNNKTKKIEELLGYKKLEGKQITIPFVNTWYKKNFDKFLISYDASVDNVSIIKPGADKKKQKKTKFRFNVGDRVIYNSPVDNNMKGLGKRKEGKDYPGTVIEQPQYRGDAYHVALDADKNLADYAKVSHCADDRLRPE